MCLALNVDLSEIVNYSLYIIILNVTKNENT